MSPPTKRDAGDPDILGFMSKRKATYTGVEARASLLANAGTGLFATAPIAKGDVACEYFGEVITLAKMMKREDRTYIMGGFGLKWWVDALSHPEALGRYINDHHDPGSINVKFVKLKEEKIALCVALRDIRPGEELYVSYGRFYWEKIGGIPKPEGPPGGVAGAGSAQSAGEQRQGLLPPKTEKKGARGRALHLAGQVAWAVAVAAAVRLGYVLNSRAEGYAGIQDAAEGRDPAGWPSWMRVRWSTARGGEGGGEVPKKSRAEARRERAAELAEDGK